MSGEKAFVREYRTYCGAEYMTVDMFQCSASAEGKAKASRSRRERVSPPKQKALNSKRAKRYFVQLANANFGAGDYHLTATYSQGMLPESEEEAKRVITNYLRRVSRRRKKKDLPPLKYILVTECGLSRRTGKPARIHHHLIVSGGLSREEMEMMWTEERISWKRAETDEGYARSIQKIGFVNCDNLQPGENGLEALGKYLTKDPAGKKRWSCSQNLEKPVRVRRDRKYSVRKLENMARSGDIWTRDFWEEKYPGYTLAGSADIAVEAEPPDEFNNWIIYAKLRKTEQGGNTR
jgi:hypothetical protein